MADGFISYLTDLDHLQTCREQQNGQACLSTVARWMPNYCLG